MRKLLLDPQKLEVAVPQPLSSSPPPPSPHIVSRLSANLFNSGPAHTLAFDLITLTAIAAVLLLSAAAFGAILNLLLKSRRAPQLRHFNALWTVRSLLVTFVSLWAANELLRLPLVRRNYLHPFSLEQQSNTCKFHVVFSLGFLEPGFLITLFFLIRVSVKQRKPRKLWSLVIILMLCVPWILLQVFFVYFYSLDGGWLSEFVHTESSFLSVNKYGGQNIVLCTYPLLSAAVFAAFAAVYGIAFMVSFWRVVAFVINKGIGYRINVLAASVMVALPAQIVGICLSWMWWPEDAAYGGVVLAVFMCVGWCVAVGEVILVIKPVRETLEAGGDCCRWSATATRGDGRIASGAAPGAIGKK